MDHLIRQKHTSIETTELANVFIPPPLKIYKKKRKKPIKKDEKEVLRHFARLAKLEKWVFTAEAQGEVQEELSAAEICRRTADHACRACKMEDQDKVVFGEVRMVQMRHLAKHEVFNRQPVDTRD